MVAENIRQVPGLNVAWVEPGQSEPIKLGERVIPEAFKCFFHFKDKSKTWYVELNVRIDQHGTPVLISVVTIGSQIVNGETESVKRWQLKIVEQYRQILLELAVELAITTTWPTVMLRREYSVANIAFVRATTGLGHKPNELVLEHPSTITGTMPNGEPADFVRFWDGNPEPTTTKQLTKLQNEISKSVRQRITPKFLKEVADIYKRAVADGLDPHTEIMSVYKCAHRTAQEWAHKARSPHLKFLPLTTQGKVTVKSKPKRKGKT